MNTKQLKNKKFLATALAVTVLVSGTYAWQAFSQEVTNEKITGVGLPGGRLHDYFDGTDKDVFIENYTTAAEGENVYARIRIDEYFESGANAGTADAKNPTILRGDLAQSAETTPTLNNKDSWDTYIHRADGDITPDSEIREYRDLELGGSSVYMPTFNQNIDDLEPDFNGTFRDEYNEIKEEPYDDFEKYTVGGTPSTATDKVVTVDGTASTATTHTAKETKTADITTMAEWLDDGAPISDTWVFDVDGWAYYAAPIAPETATGLLIDGITVIDSPSQQWYYAVNVTAQIATAGDWGAEDDDDTASSMYASNMTDEGVYLLNRVSGLVTVEEMLVKNTDDSQLELEDVQIASGTDKTYQVFYTVVNGEGLDNETIMDWTIEEVASDSSSGADLSNVLDYTSGQDTVKFSPTSDMEGYQYKITATSALDSSKTVYITVSVPVAE